MCWSLSHHFWVNNTSNVPNIIIIETNCKKSVSPPPSINFISPPTSNILIMFWTSPSDTFSMEQPLNYLNYRVSTPLPGWKSVHFPDFFTNILYSLHEIFEKSSCLETQNYSTFSLNQNQLCYFPHICQHEILYFYLTYLPIFQPFLILPANSPPFQGIKNWNLILTLSTFSLPMGTPGMISNILVMFWQY